MRSPKEAGGAGDRPRTNVLVRVLTNDDPAQTRIALARLRDESLFLAAPPC